MGCFSSNEKPKKFYQNSSYENVNNQIENNNVNNVNSGNNQVNISNQQVKKCPGYNKGKAILVSRQDK